ncbi:MAG: methyl-accepting chemotaxis protein [Lachnospiraceae bacterium]|nr:methyl-accepting chemotaxis protein [Lachnospiraceae bacterium]
MSIRRKLQIAISLMCIVCCCLVGIAAYIQVENMVIRQTKEDAMGLASVAAGEIDGAAYAAMEDSSDEYFQEVYDILAKYKGSGILDYIYSMRMDGDQLVFVVDTDDDEPAELGDAYELIDDMLPVFDGEVCCDSEISSDEWGSYFSAYAPIVDQDGNVTGLVGCDVSIDSFHAQMRSLQIIFVVILVVVILLSVLLSLWLSNNIGKNLASLYRKVKDLNSGDGNLTQQLEIRSGDELEAIAEEFNVFIRQIRALVAQVASTSGVVEGNSQNVNSSVAVCNQELSEITDLLEGLSARMEETSASTETISSELSNASDTVDGLNDEALQASRKARLISKKALKTKKDTERVELEAENMVMDIRQRLERAMEECKAIEQIDRITEEILEVAGTTEILSLNASIEAARAGEYGSGFAIIAGDINKLSQQIGTLITRIQDTNQQVKEAVNDLIGNVNGTSDYLNQNVMDDYKRFVQIGGDYSTNMSSIAQLMNRFCEMTQGINDRIAHIEEELREMDRVIGEGAQGITNVHENGVTLKNEVGQLLKLAEDSSEESKKMNEQVNRYTF